MSAAPNAQTGSAPQAEPPPPVAPQATPTYRYAGFWIRLGAYLIDSLLLQLATSLVALALLLAAPSFATHETLTDFEGLAGLAISIAYYCGFCAGPWQATPGKRVLGLYIVRVDGRRVTGWLALGRLFSYILSGLAFALGFLMIFWSDQRKALHDMICGTRVVYGKAPSA